MMMDVSKQMGDKALNRCYTDNISAGIDWLEKDIGVKFGKIRPMPYPRLAVPAASWAKASPRRPARAEASCRLRQARHRSEVPAQGR